MQEVPSSPAPVQQDLRFIAQAFLEACRLGSPEKVAVARYHLECAALEALCSFPGLSLIIAERQRQIEISGWSSDHDDSHEASELAEEASRWAREGTVIQSYEDGLCGSKQHRMSKDRIQQLVIAGALTAAEIDRLLRLHAKTA